MQLPPYDRFANISDDKILLRQIQFFDISELIEISFYDATGDNDQTSYLNADQNKCRL